MPLVTNMYESEPQDIKITKDMMPRYEVAYDDASPNAPGRARLVVPNELRQHLMGLPIAVLEISEKIAKLKLREASVKQECSAIEAQAKADSAHLKNAELRKAGANEILAESATYQKFQADLKDLSIQIETATIQHTYHT